MSNIRKTAIAIALGISVVSLAGCGGGGGGGGGGGDNGADNGGNGDNGNGDTPVEPDIWSGSSTLSTNGEEGVQELTLEILAGTPVDRVTLKTEDSDAVTENAALLSLGRGSTFHDMTSGLEAYFLPENDTHGALVYEGGNLDEDVWRIAVVQKDASIDLPEGNGALSDLEGQWSGWVAAAFADTYYEYPVTMTCASQFCSVTASDESLDVDGQIYEFGPPVGTQTQFELTHREQQVFDHDRGVFMTSPDTEFVGVTRCGRFLTSCEIGAFSRVWGGGED